MVVAMMLPTQLPLIITLQRNTRYAPTILFGSLLIGGYLAAWTLYGVVVYAADWLLHQALSALPSLQRQAWALGALSLIVAGIYQLTPAKRSFLDTLHPAARDGIARQKPTRFIAAHAVMLGVRHGLCCVGCCWALMLLMFGAGAGAFGWMLALGTIMMLEKNVSWGRRLIVPLGCMLIVSGVLVLFFAAPVSGHAGHLH